MINIAEHGKDPFDNSIWWFREALPQYSNSKSNNVYKYTERKKTRICGLTDFKRRLKCESNKMNSAALFWFFFFLDLLTLVSVCYLMF